MTNCRPHVEPTVSGRRWHAWCDCGWNTQDRAPTRATQREAMALAIWHVRTPLRMKAQAELERRISGGSTTYGKPAAKLRSGH